MFITYLTIYKGNKLPPFYIGSTSLKKYLEGYNGTVLSKKYKAIYQKEQQEHPELFDSLIIDEFTTREEATECERYYQKQMDVVKSKLFFNMAIAAPEGCFGMDVSGENHPLYGTHNGKGNIHSYHPETLEQVFLPEIPEGFVKGRGPNYKASGHNKGKKWYNNGIKSVLYHKGYEPVGWIEGKLKGPQIQWYNNGTGNRKFKEGQESVGFIKGRIETKKAWFNDGIKNYFIPSYEKGLLIEGRLKHQKGMKWYFTGEKYTRCFPSEALPNWVQKGLNGRIGKKWFNDGIKNYSINPGEEQPNWLPGKIHRK